VLLITEVRFHCSSTYADSRCTTGALMERYRGQRDNTAVLSLFRDGNVYRRQDVIKAVKSDVGKGKIVGLGQLESNVRWEVVFTDDESKRRFLGSQVVRGNVATVGDLHHKPRILRIQKIPMCIPNDYIGTLLKKRGLKVHRLEYEINKSDHLVSNTRSSLVDTEDWDEVPDYLPWNFDGLKGVALLFLQGRPSKCHRCGERGHRFFECRHPFCTRCRRVGHVNDECHGSYAQMVSVRNVPDNYDEHDDEMVETETNDNEPNSDDVQTTSNITSWAEETDRVLAEQAASLDPQHERPTQQQQEQESQLQHQPASHSQSDTESDFDTVGDEGDDGDDESTETTTTTTTTATTVGGDEGFRQPAAHVRRASKRSRKECRVESRKQDGPVDQQEQLDPTAGRSNSRTRVYSGRRRTSD